MAEPRTDLQIRAAVAPKGAVQDGLGPQRLRALDRANHVRTVRANLKRRLRAGEEAAAEAILRCSRDTDTMTIGELLTSQRGWGPRRSTLMLRSVSVSERKTLGSLTERQRGELVRALGPVLALA